jgi:regulator of sigma E protease
VQVGDVTHPYFEDLKLKVMLSDSGEHVPFVWRTPGQEARAVTIEPRKTKDEPNPVIGIGYPWALKLPEEREVPKGTGPVERNSAAADARALELGPDDQLLAATDALPLNPVEAPARAALTDLNPADPAGDLAGRLRQLAGKPVTVRFRRGDKEEQVTLEPGSGFQFGDRIVGTTDPDSDGGHNPFHTAPLQPDPRDPQGRNLDYFQFLQRLDRLADRPVVIQVRRKDRPASEVVNVFVPPAYHRVIPGVRMAMGTVTALREGSTADAASVKVHDTITAVTLTDGKESVTFSATPGPGEMPLDPQRLTFDLRRWAAGRDGVTASLKVRRVMQTDAAAVAEVPGLKWDNSWRYDEELPLGTRGSLAIPELGIAYQVLAQVAAVVPDKQKKLRAEDFILAWTFQVPGKDVGEPDKWGKPVELGSKDNPTGSADPGWAAYSYRMQQISSPLIKLLVRHADGEKEEVEIELQTDVTWPLFDPLKPRGLLLFPMQDRIAVAPSMGEAVQMGWRYTVRTILQIYSSLKSLVTRRVSATENLQGPIDIAVVAYDTAGRDWADFLLLLGLISVNLAVVNFLPIPVLDGGHMVFLLYEKLRGRPASEHVRQASTLVGILFLVSLMIFVIGLGVYRWIWPLITG